MTDSAQRLELARPRDRKLDDFPPGDVLDHEAAYDLFDALRDATANTWHEIAARHFAYHRARAALRSSALPETGEPVAYVPRSQHPDYLGELLWKETFGAEWKYKDTWRGFDLMPLYARPSPDGAVREALRHLFALTDQSNWGDISGDYFKGYQDAMEQVHTVASDLQAALSTAPQQDELKPHHYQAAPAQFMGDCAICGHREGSAIHITQQGGEPVVSRPHRGTPSIGAEPLKPRRGD